MGLTRAENEQLLKLLEERQSRYNRRKFFRMFPDEDTEQQDGTLVHARHKYPKHIEFFDTGREYNERCFLAANRVGKTVGGAFESTCHLTGDYPDWWTGRRFTKPTQGWACGKTNETTRDIVQAELFGEITGAGSNRKGFNGTGMIPGASIGKITWKQGVSDLADTIKIKHKSGGWSILGLKSYQQGRSAFEGTARHFIWDDEEPPIDVYGEQLIRTATTNGIIFITFTPLEGLSETVLQFMPADMRPDSFEEEQEF